MKTIATWIRECDEALFARALAPFPELRLANARTENAAFDEADALLLTGGTDISEKFLRQPVTETGRAQIRNPDFARDMWEFDATAKALARRLALLAICRGVQVLNVALGGTLHLDVPNHNGAKDENTQPLQYADGAAIRFPRVNSSHHQALDRLGAGLVAEAWCADDGLVEQVRLQGYPFALGVQYHPERDEAYYQALFEAFAGAVR